MVNAATRAMLNNAGKSAGSQVVLDRSCITPANGTAPTTGLTPDKIWFKNADSPAMDDVRKAFTIFNIPNVTPQMMEIINYGMQLAEESTSIPLITQGQDGPTTPDTLGATQLQNSNANQLAAHHRLHLRRLCDRARGQGLLRMAAAGPGCAGRGEGGVRD
jgi:hypothetical protein